MEANSKFKSFVKYFSKQYYKSNVSLCIFLLIYNAIQVCLVIMQVFKYIREPMAIQIARTAGILLDFNMSLTVLLVLKRCLTWIGSVKIFRTCLPLKDFPKIHKVIGIYILLLSLIHTIAHCANVCK